MTNKKQNHLLSPTKTNTRTECIKSRWINERQGSIENALRLVKTSLILPPSLPSPGKYDQRKHFISAAEIQATTSNENNGWQR